MERAVLQEPTRSSSSLLRSAPPAARPPVPRLQSPVDVQRFGPVLSVSVDVVTPVPGSYSLRLEGGASRCQGEVQLQRPDCDEVLSVSDFVRLVGGSGLSSGSLQIWDQSWIPVCEGALDLRGAEVLCRELGCDDPSVLQGELSPLGPTFHCEGHESALMDCPRSRPKTCFSGPSEDIICSGWREEPAAVLGSWSSDTEESGDEWILDPGGDSSCVQRPGLWICCF
uniref:SRCR domain-containing protein n=1 Tax=Knipowitschia caucasica TaxID=637954 RepID=A0AAV2MHP0_KNICA